MIYIIADFDCRLLSASVTNVELVSITSSKEEFIRFFTSKDLSLLNNDQSCEDTFWLIFNIHTLLALNEVLSPGSEMARASYTYTLLQCTDYIRRLADSKQILASY